MNYFSQFLTLTLIGGGGGGGGIENFVNVNLNKNLGKKKSENRLPTKFARFMNFQKLLLSSSELFAS